MSKPTQEEIVEALRALAQHSPEGGDDGRESCVFCGGFLREPEWRMTSEKGRELELGHRDGCPVVAARALIARLDAQEGPTYSDLKFEGPTLEEFGRFTVAPIADDGEPECPPPDEPDYPGEASL